jgi:enhancing lycopene biosynthesis protein 2
LTFLQAAKAVCLDGGEVHENVLTILAADKTIALGVIKPLYCSCFHDVARVPLVEVCAGTRRIVQAGHALERGTADNRKDQTQLNCTYPKVNG